MKNAIAIAFAVAAVSLAAFAVDAGTQALVEMSGCETGRLVALPDKAFADFREFTDKRIAEIRATPNMEIPAGAERRYLSEKGDDGSDGKTPATAWRTTARLEREKLPYGAFVLFERGGLFRGGFKASSGVTYTAYGKGAKPRVYSSPENGADPAKWERTDAENVWRYKIGTADVGTLVFNDGEAHAIKILPVYNDDGTFTQQYGGRPFNNGYKDLADDLHFWHDYSAKTDFKPYAIGSGYLYLYSKLNPGERFKTIEFCVRKHGVAVGGASNVHVDNLCIKYVGSHGVGAGTVRGLRITNCEFGWIGGSIQAERIFGRKWAVRFGNAVEIYGGCDGFTVENCYIYQVYDAGLTQQVGIGSLEDIRDQKGVRYSRNVIENCNYSIEYFLSLRSFRDNPSRMEDFVIEDNLMWNAGVGFCQQRPNRHQSAHIKSWRNNSNRATGYIVRRNLFACGADMLVEISSGLANPDGSDSMPVMEGNVFIGTVSQRFGVVNQGRPMERVYDANLVSALGERFSGNVYAALAVFGADAPEVRNILCWGDSVTEGMAMPRGKDYPARLEALLGDGYRVFNSGDGGENSITIPARQGAVSLATAAPIVFAAGESAVKIGDAGDNGFHTSSGDRIMLTAARGRNISVNPVKIDGKPYKLSFRDFRWNSPTNKISYTLWLSRDGDRSESRLEIPAKTPVKFASVDAVAGAYCEIFFMGANGGWGNDVRKLISQVRAMVARRGDDKPYLVIVPYWKGFSQQNEGKIKAAFGVHAVAFPVEDALCYRNRTDVHLN